MSAILEGEKCTPDTLICAEVTTASIGSEGFHREKGMVRITLSEEKWIELMKYIDERREHIHNLRIHRREVPGLRGGING